MHIPDGWLSLQVIIFTWSITLIALGLSLSKIKKDDLTRLSNIGAVSAVIFVAQMFNFPIAFGTSGHLLGAALATYILGLPGAIIAVFIVLLVQAIVFADGGIFALGANTFNMGVVGAVIAYFIIRLSMKHKNKLIYYSGVFLSAFFAVVVASFFAGMELVLSGITTFSVSLPPILFWHVLIGIGEGTISVFIISYLKQIDFPLYDHEQSITHSFIDSVKNSNKPIIGFGFLLLLLSILSLFASSSPDGLARFGIDQGFGDGYAFGLGVANDYDFLGIGGIFGTLLSALLGVIIISGLLILPAVYIKEQKVISKSG